MRPSVRGRRTTVGFMLLALLAPACSQPGTHPAGAPTTTPAVTQVLTFQAFDDQGLLPNLVRVAAVAGTCQGGSVVHPGRADAWRCRTGDASYDPCFANSTGEELACVADPWAREATVLRPASPLGRAGSNRNDPGLPPWFIELVDGTRCGRTAPPATTYLCAVGADASEPDATRPRWTVGRGPVTDEVRTAWY